MSAKASQEVPSLGVLFVHGIGDQRQGQTLSDFGTPLFEWLSRRASQLGASVVITQTELTPEGGPAYSELRLQRDGQGRAWVFAETWWAESFAARSFGELAEWSFSVVPWTFGSHFGRRFQKVWRSRKRGLVNFVRWTNNVLTALIALLTGLAVSILAIILFAALLLISLIPWRRLQASIQNLQVRLAATIGDSLIFVRRPIEFAAILTQFRTDLEWLLAQKCERVAVVAHSQGGAIAVHGLLDDVPDRVGLLITFGSGLRKLEELIALKDNRSRRRGAMLTLVGLVIVTGFVLFSVRALAKLPPLATIASQPILDLAVGGALFIAYGVVGFTVLIAGLWDFVRVPTPEHVFDLCRFFKSQPLEWKDIYATADPVPNGHLHDDANLPPESIEVVNRGSMLGDHTAYWANADTFVARVADTLLSYDAPAILPLVQPEVVHELIERRRRRVRLLQFSGWLGFASLVMLVLIYWDEWKSVALWSLTKTADAVARLLSGHATVAPIPNYTQWSHSVGWLILLVAAQFFGNRTWVLYDRLVTEKPPPYDYTGDFQFLIMAALWIQIICIGAAATGGGELPSWFFFAGLVVSTVAVMASTPIHTTSRVPAAQDLSTADRMARKLNELVGVITKPLGIIVFFVFSAIWTRKLSSRFLGYDLSWIVAVIVGPAAVFLVMWVLLFFVFLVAEKVRRRRNGVQSL